MKGSMITAIEMGSREGMVAFCKGSQLACPVGSYIRPEPGEHCERHTAAQHCCEGACCATHTASVSGWFIHQAIAR
jgi:cystathionine beta-lyase family protein involved in aluminum resistance